MSEINENVQNEETQENGTVEETAGQQIVVQEESKLKRFAKGAVKFLVGLALGAAAGFGIAKATGGSDDNSDGADAEGPKED